MSPLARHLELAPTDDPCATLAPRTRFIGRSTDIAQVLSLLERKERLCTLIGWVGIGKTHLARVAADAWRNEAPSRVLRCVDLVHEKHIEDAIDAAFVCREPTLILVDSGEHFDAATINKLATKLDQTPLARVLATARAPLGLTAEIRYWLAPLSLEAGVELFCDRVQSACAGTCGENEYVEKIVATVGGHPLSIELAAAQADVLSFQEIFEKLSDRFSLLRCERREVAARHRSIEASIAGAWASLRPHEERALLKCVALGDQFTLAEAEALAAFGDEEGHDTIELLRTLVSRSFLMPLSADGTRKFVWSPNVRAYAATRIPSESRELEVCAEKRTVRIGRRTLSLKRRRAPWLIVARLVAERETNPGRALDVPALTEAGWPEERITPDAAAARVYFVVRELRKAGLEEVLLTVAEGYLLDPAIAIVQR